MKIIVTIILSIISVFCQAKTIKIKDIGLRLHEFSIENFEILRKAHLQAMAENLKIDYSGVDTIRLLVPSDASSIPLSYDMDFKGVVFIVKNNNKNFYLFKYSKDLIPIEIDKKIIGKSNMIMEETLLNKTILLVIRDKNPWVKERVGYGFPHIRQDLLIVKNGKAQNSPIQSYGEYSDPEFFYNVVDGKTLNIKNFRLLRSKDSTFKTFGLYISNIDGVSLKNIIVHTPESSMYADEIINLNNCANVRMCDIVIDGTYSQFDKYGYGISMNNVYNVTFKRVVGHGNWGVFGTNNVNLVHIDNCDLNRFDIHCYGKDVYCKNTVFRDLYNQFGSFYGTLSYDNCDFIKFVPVTNDGSYSAFTPFNVYFKNCRIMNSSMLCNMSYSKYLIYDIRPELKQIVWPNIFMDNVDIKCTPNVKDYYLYHTYHKEKIVLDRPTSIQFKNVNMNSTKIVLSNSEVQCDSIKFFVPTYL